LIETVYEPAERLGNSAITELPLKETIVSCVVLPDVVVVVEIVGARPVELKLIPTMFTWFGVVV